MDTIKAIKTRRSIRKYSDDDIPIEKLRQIIECGMYAPSAGNEQPWHFILIQDKNQLRNIPEVHEHARMMPIASAGILVCIDSSLEKHKDMGVQDCSAATQNMLLAIHDLGYAGCWLGVYPREKRMIGLKTLFNIPDGIIPFSLIAVGVPNEEKNPVNRMREERIHHEQW